MMDINQLIKAGALFVCNHSGGKDSQAMYLYLKDIIPANQLVVIHAHLQGVEWEGTIDHIKATICPDHRFYIVQSRRSLLQMIEERGMFPSPKNRQCTSDLKRGPINKQVIAICNQFGFKTVVNCMGLRAEESSGRAKNPIFRLNNTYSNSKRTWYEYLPIHSWLTTEVFEYIKSHNQQPHWAYAKGMTRLSCCFCIMASEQDLYTASKLNPELFGKYLALEKSTGQTMLMPSKSKGKRFLDQVVDDYASKQAI